MAFILTDAKEYRELPCPGQATIGRGIDNSIRPESQSVSKNHAIFSVNRISDTSKIEIWLEDLNSRNGTFVGESPLDFERVNGRRRLQFGDYIRFGHSQKFFRILDHIPYDNESEVVAVPTMPVKSVGGFGDSLGMAETRGADMSRNSSAMGLNVGSASRYDVYQPESRAEGSIQRHRNIDADYDDEEDFNVVLKYNGKRNNASQPVSLHIGGTEVSRNSVNSVGRNSKDGENSIQPGYSVERLTGEGGGGVHNFNSPDSKSALAVSDHRVQFQLGGRDVKHSSVESLQEMKGNALRSYDDAKDIVRGNQQSRSHNHIFGMSEDIDYVPKLFFHAYASSIYNKDSVAKYFAGLRDWEGYVRDGLNPTSAKVDIFFRQLLEQHSDNPLTKREDRDIIELPKIIQQYNSLSQSDKESLSAELIVDSIHASGAAHSQQSLLHDVGQCILALQALNRSCRLGINLGDTSQFNQYGEVDMALMQEITSIVKAEMQRLSSLEQSQLAGTLKYAAGTGHKFNIERLFTQSSDILLSIQTFIATMIQSNHSNNRGHPSVTNSMQQRISSSDCFEIISLCLLEILWRLWQSYGTLLGLLAIVQEMVTQRVLANGGSINDGSSSNQIGSLAGVGSMPNLAILREKMFNGDEDSVLQVLQDFKSQHVNTAFQRFGRVQRLFEILRRLSLRNAFRHWSLRGFQMKKRGLQLMEAEDTVINRVRGRHFFKWLRLYRRKKQLRKAIYRMVRSIKANHRVPLAWGFKQWKEVAGFNVNLHPSLSAMRLQLLKLQNDLAVLTNTQETAGILAAERALNKELIASNAHLRDTLQEYEMKILDSSALPMAKKQEVAYHYLLKKEEELQDAKKEAKLVRSELENLRNTLAHRRPAATPAGLLSPQQPSSKHVPMSTNTYRAPPPTAPASHGNPSRPGVRLHPNMDNTPAMMSKDEAKLVVLNEVRRLKDSLVHSQQSKDELHALYATELDKNVQMSLANQSLANRVIELERSAVLLRELLLQRLGATAVLDLTEAMTSTGAGAHILLNSIPVASTASQASDSDYGSRRHAAHKQAPPSHSTVTNRSGARFYTGPNGNEGPGYAVSSSSGQYQNAVSAAFFKDQDDDEDDRVEEERKKKMAASSRRR